LSDKNKEIHAVFGLKLQKLANSAFFCPLKPVNLVRSERVRRITWFLLL